MKANFDKCLEMLLHHEGGYVNHPDDPGGETNLGVTKKVYVASGGKKSMKKLTVKDVTGLVLNVMTSLAVWIFVRSIGV